MYRKPKKQLIVTPPKPKPPADSGPHFTGWPALIVWPADTPEAILPNVADWRRLGEDDQRIEAAYYNEADLRKSVHGLALVREAEAFGGVVRKDEE